MIIGQEDVKSKLNTAVKKNMAVLLIGETGTGKTSIVRDIANNQTTVVRVNLNGQTSVEDFVGRKGLKDGQTFWEDGVLLECMRKGYWIIVDEINSALPEILFVLHSLLDDGNEILVNQNDNEIVKPHEDFRFFATMNPVDEYAGTKGLNKALKSRFGMVITMDYPDNEVEMKIIEEKTPVRDLETLTIMIETANRVRKLKEENEVFYTLSTRDLIQWGCLIDDLELEEAFEVAVLNKAGLDKEVIKNTWIELYDKADSIFNQHETSKKMGINYLDNQFKKLRREREDMKEKIKEEEKERIRKKVIEELSSQLIGEKKI